MIGCRLNGGRLSNFYVRGFTAALGLLVDSYNLRGYGNDALEKFNSPTSFECLIKLLSNSYVESPIGILNPGGLIIY